MCEYSCGVFDLGAIVLDCFDLKKYFECVFYLIKLHYEYDDTTDSVCEICE